LINRKKNIIIITVLGAVLSAGIVFFTISKPDNVSSSYQNEPGTVISEIDDINEPEANDTYENTTNAPTASPVAAPTPTEVPEEPFVPATEIDLDPESITVFVNPEYNLPKNYAPKDLVQVNVYFHLKTYDERTYMRKEAAQALEKLFAAAKEAGYELCGVSGYRSYYRQYQIFVNNMLTKGKEHTLKYSAVPGASEHQTGLAMDVSCKSLKYDLSTRFSTTPEGKWLAQNAHLYGYIIRYPDDKADITGYAYEPWHIRYVGKGLAKYLYENDLTLEEYYNYTPARDFNFETKYAHLINITPSPTPSIPVPSGLDGIITDENGEIIDEVTDMQPSPTLTPAIPDIPDVSPTPVPMDEPVEEDDKQDGQDWPDWQNEQGLPAENPTGIPDNPDITDFPDNDITPEDSTNDSYFNTGGI